MELSLQLIDVSRAHFYAQAVRDVFIQLPPEDPQAANGDLVGKLDRTMYGTLDAAERWAEHYSKILVQAGFRRGTASPCHFYHSSRDLWVLVHGDDFFSVGETDDQEYLRQLMQDSFEIKCNRASASGPCRELRILGRIVSYTPDGLQLEADPQHLEVCADALGLVGAKGVSSPTACDECRLSATTLKKIRLELEKGQPDYSEASPALSDADTKVFMSLAARLNYLGFDRPDIQYAVKELMRKMINPTVADLVSLKRVVRYLLTVPRYVLTVPWQSLPDRIRVYVDANWAGCLRTRKSTLGGIICFGHMPVKCYSKTMAILALSSGESELAAVVKGAGEGLGFQSSLQDFDLELPLELYSDVTAAIGMCKREGLGRVRHLSTSD